MAARCQCREGVGPAPSDRLGQCGKIVLVGFAKDSQGGSVRGVRVESGHFPNVKAADFKRWTSGVGCSWPPPHPQKFWLRPERQNWSPPRVCTFRSPGNTLSNAQGFGGKDGWRVLSWRLRGHNREASIRWIIIADLQRPCLAGQVSSKRFFLFFFLPLSSLIALFLKTVCPLTCFLHHSV